MASCMSALMDTYKIDLQDTVPMQSMFLSTKVRFAIKFPIILLSIETTVYSGDAWLVSSPIVSLGVDTAPAKSCRN